MREQMITLNNMIAKIKEQYQQLQQQQQVATGHGQDQAALDAALTERDQLRTVRIMLSCVLHDSFVMGANLFVCFL